MVGSLAQVLFAVGLERPAIPVLIPNMSADQDLLGANATIIS
jgi:hypothetical protein